MDLAAIQARLQTLGVSLVHKDDPAQLAATLRLQRQYRASLYIDRLDAVRQHFTGTLAGPLPGGLGADYPFVQTALSSGALLNDLALSLDEWICPGVEKAMNLALAAGGVAPATDIGWFDTDIFNPVLATFNNNVAGFFLQYPIVQNAITQITANFQNNVTEAVTRMLADRPAITGLFADQYSGLSLRSLKSIRSSGSDFHKAGRQVLFLEFVVREWGGYWPTSSTLKLVYKPADLEVDCLLYGNSAAVNNATGGAFMANSLIELCNNYIAANPAAGVEQMPTYRILPRNPTSGGAPPIALHAAYGYMEFLASEWPDYGGIPWGNFTYYPFGQSDFVIFENDLSGPVIEPFYHRAGQLLALAATFSLTDLHIENVRVTRYNPHLIDLEASLTKRIDNVEQTLLVQTPGLNEFGGFTGENRDNEDYVYVCRPDPQAAGQYYMDQVFIDKFYDNRLYVIRGAKTVVDVNVFWMLEGLHNGLGVIRGLQLAGAAGGLPAWQLRIQNVLVRILPVATPDWNGVRRAVYYEEVINTPPPAALAPAIADSAVRQVTALYNQWNPAAPPPLPDPKFVAAAAPQVAVDLTSFDVPTFYHQVGSTDLLDSTGAVIPVPANVNILAGGIVGPAPSNVGRATYYAAAPTATNVVPQIAALAGGGGAFALAAAARQQQVLQTLQLLAPPANPGVMP